MLFNDGHVLELRAETFGACRRMIYDLCDIWWSYENRGRMWLKFSDIYLTAEGKPRKKRNHEIELTGNRTRASCVKSNDVTPRTQRWSPWLRTILWSPVISIVFYTSINFCPVSVSVFGLAERRRCHTVVPIPGCRKVRHRDTKVGPTVRQMSQFRRWICWKIAEHLLYLFQ